MFPCFFLNYGILSEDRKHVILCFLKIVEVMTEKTMFCVSLRECDLSSNIFLVSCKNINHSSDALVI